MKPTKLIAAVVLLPVLVLGTACQGPPDPRMRHARESADWQAFDANLSILYGARRSLREPILLPHQPRQQTELEAVGWAFAVALERMRLADLIRSETLNDLEHCKSAARLAEEQVEAAKTRHTKALEGLGPAILKLKQSIDRGDPEQNRQILERLLSPLPSLYRSTFLSVVDGR
jgi:hypothetical protein